eukprot:CAMPEP_0203639256 /NCGR_PEP_ID=MMETSP0088-20131115/5052_1 /ASSEMBLY_ACC=CAM_ASM_001087 /TAXON_ID=426623 /ORGANISM="Chaetoceros affinis, Strain CCMP159" /LENGTH=349 /DNA_ID=CAMNT_0050494093 /DNA_START=243 /DNA_END=1292 /DNA_ORIENTATION=+
MNTSQGRQLPCPPSKICAFLFLITSHVLTLVRAGSSSSNIDYSIYGMSMQRDWMYDSKSISLKFLGCVWGFVDADNGENMGCMPNDSEDGTSSWYQMANCRRAQVAYGMYASSGSTNCKNGDFKESFVTKNGIAEFGYMLGNYGYNSPITYDDTGSFPVCEGDGNGYYLSVGCSSSGGFTIDRFSDQYCLEYYDTYDTLSNFNSAMKNLKCYNCYSSSTDSDVSYSLASYLVADSGSCSESESSLCTTSSFVANSGSGAYQHAHFGSSGTLTFSNKLKYGLGSLMMAGSIIMFIGILFTNRRKRHAMMHRKFRQSSEKKKKKKKSPSSKKSSRSRSSNRKSSSNHGVFA